MRSMSLRLMEIYIFYGKLMKISIKRVFIQFFRFTTVAEIPIYEEKNFHNSVFGVISVKTWRMSMYAKIVATSSKTN